MSSDDPRWQSLKGGYRIPYDPRPALDQLRTDGDDASTWNELWENLHHQGDVGDASYVALVELVKLRSARPLPIRQLFALASTIEVERHRRTNPPVPEWLVADYRGAWSALLELAITELKASNDHHVVQSALAVVAFAKGFSTLGAVVWYHDDSTLVEFLDERLRWTELYGKRG